MNKKELESEMIDNIILENNKEWIVSAPQYELTEGFDITIENIEPKNASSLDQIESFKVSIDIMGGEAIYTYMRKRNERSKKNK